MDPVLRIARPDTEVGIGEVGLRVDPDPGPGLDLEALDLGGPVGRFELDPLRGRPKGDRRERGDGAENAETTQEDESPAAGIPTVAKFALHRFQAGKEGLTIQRSHIFTADQILDQPTDHC